MNELDLIAGLRPAVPLPESDDLAVARSRLTSVLAGERGSARQRPQRGRAAVVGRRVAEGARSRRGLLLGAAAAAVAVVCGLTFAVSAARSGGADRSGQAPRRQADQRRLGHPAQPVTLPATLTAAQFLTHAAAATRHEHAVVPAPDQFIYSAGAGNNGVWWRTWESVNGSRPGVTDLSTGGWGSSSACTQAQAESTGCTPTGFLPDFPVNANAVMPYLVRLEQASASVPSSQDPPNWLANDTGKAVAGLLQFVYLLPAQQAAVFQMLAQTSGFEIVRNAVDAQGHSGVGIYWFYQDSGAMIVFNPASYQFMGFGTWPAGAVPANGQVPRAVRGVVSAPDAGTQTPWTIVKSEPPAPPAPKLTHREWLASMFEQARLWGASLPDHQHLTLGVIMADYLRKIQHQSPAQVQADMRAIAKTNLLLCTLDSPQGLKSFITAFRGRHGDRHPAVNPACWQ
jgi:hypothetical protein